MLAEKPALGFCKLSFMGYSGQNLEDHSANRNAAGKDQVMLVML